MNRENISDKYKWDIDAIYSSKQKFEEDFNNVKDKISNINKLENNMLDNGKRLYETLNYYFDLSRNLEKLYCYANLLFDTDTSNNESQTLKGRVTNLYSLLSKNSCFININILNLDDDTLEQFYKEEPSLLKYKKNINDILRYKKHRLSNEEEQLLANINKVLGNNYDTYELFKDCDMKYDNITDEEGKIVELTSNNYAIYIESKNRKVRKDAFNTLYKTYKQYTNTYSSLFYNNIQEEVTISKLRKYNSSLEASLFDDEVDTIIYNNLIKNVSEGLNGLYKYYDLKKKVLGLDEIHIYDIYVNMINDYNKKYPFDEAVDIVRKALSVLGDEYISIYDSGIKNRWIDVYPTKNKRTGGYSSGCYDSYPYVLLNYQDKYSDMSTLAHEMGHSIHSYYTRKNNDYSYGDYSIFVAEVASTVNELLLANYILNNSSNRDEKLYILNKMLELFKSTIYRQTMFAEFEKEVYELVEKDNILTSELLCKKYYELNKKYFGNDVVVDEEIAYEWERIPHFYYNFYVYKYATGLSCACKIVDGILNKQENAVENYINFLKCGRTKNPIDSLKVAGVDITKKEVVESALKMFNNLVSDFTKLYFNN